MPQTPDQARFEAARGSILNQDSRVDRIGTLGEKALHAVVKQYIEMDLAKHEKKLGNFVLDIFTDDRIYEIQTRQFSKLAAKLSVCCRNIPSPSSIRCRPGNGYCGSIRTAGKSKSRVCHPNAAMCTLFFPNYIASSNFCSMQIFLWSSSRSTWKSIGS